MIKKIFILCAIVALVMFAAGCVKKTGLATDPDGEQEISIVSNTEVDTVTEDIADIDTTESDLDLEELEDLDKDLEELDW